MEHHEPMSGGIEYTFAATVWQHASPGGWYFVSLPEAFSREIREHSRWAEEGWGRLKATARIGRSAWKTAIWFDTKSGTYLLPLKADIRKSEGLEAGSAVNVTIRV